MGHILRFRLAGRTVNILMQIDYFGLKLISMMCEFEEFTIAIRRSENFYCPVKKKYEVYAACKVYSHSRVD